MLTDCSVKCSERAHTGHLQDDILYLRRHVLYICRKKDNGKQIVNKADLLKVGAEIEKYIRSLIDQQHANAVKMTMEKL